MLIADAQVHIWAPNTPERPWRAGQEPHRAEPLGPDELIREMDKAGVSRAILISPFWDGPRNDFVLAAYRQYPERFRCMGRMDAVPPPKPGEVVKWREQPGMLGIRYSMSARNPNATLDGMEWVWQEAEQGGVPFMILVPHTLSYQVDRILERHPRLKLIMSHMGVTSGTCDGEAFKDFDQLLALAKYPNMAIKVSALPTYTKDSYPYRALHPYLRRAYDAFGPKRMFWGTDMARLPCTYKQSITMITEEIPWLSAEDKEWIMGRGLCEWLGWPLPSS